MNGGVRSDRVLNVSRAETRGMSDILWVVTEFFLFDDTRYVLPWRFRGWWEGFERYALWKLMREGLF